MAVHLHLLLLQIIILLVWATKASEIQCPTSCGNVSEIRYPFGIGDGCYFNEWFEVTCDNTSGFPVPFFRRTNLKLSEGISRRSNGMAIGLGAYVNKLQAENLSGTPFSFSHKLNKFVATGCSNYTTKFDRHPIKPTTGCLPICTCDPAKDKSCYDIMCNISSSHEVFSDIKVPENCKDAVVAEQDWLKTNYLANTNPNLLKEIEYFPVVMEFGRYMGNCVEPYKPQNTSCNKDSFCLIQLNSGYFCVCSQPKENNDKSRCTGNLFCNITSQKDCSRSPRGYKSNFSHNGDDKPMRDPPEPKRPGNGRKKNINIGLFSGFGTLSLYIGARRLYEFARRRIANKLKQKFFKKNGGSLLQQRMSSNDGNIPKPKFFTEYELEKATDSYSEDRKLGQGGQGTVYKGMLKGGRIIAVKRLKRVAERVDVFIKEVEILSRFYHRNVVRFLGCCLDTEFPLLVYEFIPNGTLFQYIHDQNEEFPLTWDLCLRIAIEVADALQSAASVGIYHPDIKSSNILLDEKYQPKVSGFGTSRSIPVGQTHSTTQELGTYGYLDPEYRGSSQFTEKTGVYSFGVVLAELLTGEKPDRSTDLEEEDRSLALYFLRIMEENRLSEILDGRFEIHDARSEIFDAPVSKDVREQEIEAFANLTRICLELNWTKRPRMGEVATKLARIRASYGASILKQKCEETDYVVGDINSQLGASSSFFE